MASAHTTTSLPASLFAFENLRISQTDLIAQFILRFFFISFKATVWCCYMYSVQFTLKRLELKQSLIAYITQTIFKGPDRNNMPGLLITHDFIVFGNAIRFLIVFLLCFIVLYIFFTCSQVLGWIPGLPKYSCWIFCRR